MIPQSLSVTPRDPHPLVIQLSREGKKQGKVRNRKDKKRKVRMERHSLNWVLWWAKNMNM